MRSIIILTLVLGLCTPAFASPESFPYLTWTNKAGHSFDARFDHLEGDKVVLRARRGGRRYPVKRATLSDQSENTLRSYQTETTNKLNSLQRTPSGDIPVDLAYRAVALGLIDKLTALKNRSVRSRIGKIRVQDRLTAILELDGNCFRLLTAPTGMEFFLKSDDLYVRTAEKDNRVPYPKRLDSGARLVHSRGAAYSLRLSSSLEASWDQVGVTEGPVFR